MTLNGGSSNLSSFRAQLEMAAAQREEAKRQSQNSFVAEKATLDELEKLLDEVAAQEPRHKSRKVTGAQIIAARKEREAAARSEERVTAMLRSVELVTTSVYELVLEAKKQNHSWERMVSTLELSSRRTGDLVDTYITDVRVAELKAAKWEQLYRDLLAEKGKGSDGPTHPT